MSGLLTYVLILLWSIPRWAMIIKKSKVYTKGFNKQLLCIFPKQEMVLDRWETMLYDVKNNIWALHCKGLISAKIMQQAILTFYINRVKKKQYMMPKSTWWNILLFHFFLTKKPLILINGTNKINSTKNVFYSKTKKNCPLSSQSLHNVHFYLTHYYRS